MNLTDNLERFVQVLENIKLDTDGWKKFEDANEIDSYYVDYASSKHIGTNPIMEYDFSSPVDFKKYLDELWNETSDKHVRNLKMLMVKFMMESDNKADRMLPEVDTHNYMM